MMDIQRLILYAIFFSSAFFLWSAWQAEHAPPPAVVKPATPGAVQGDVPAPQMHAWVKSQVSWASIDDALPRYETHP